MTNLTVIGIDPGLANGVAEYVVRGGVGRFESWVGTPFDVVSWLESRLAVLPRAETFVAVERFVITPRTARLSPQHDALEVIGGVRYVTRKYGVRLSLRTKADARRVGGDTTLRRLDWRRDGDHRDMAAAQVLAELAERHHGVFTGLVAGGSV